MGVDARMFVRLKGKENWLKDEDVLKMSYGLSSTIGYDSFMITATYENWPFETHHALSIVKPATADDCDSDDEFIGKVVWFQDGDPIVADFDEQFVEVHISSRYYGPDYARGNWPTIRMTIEWLQLHFPEGVVWYGGDSSGVEAEAMTAHRMKKFNDFFLGSGRRSYTRYDSPFSQRTSFKCPVCKVEPLGCGGGGDMSFLHCDGCGSNFLETPKKVHNIRRKEFFKASQELRAGLDPEKDNEPKREGKT